MTEKESRDQIVARWRPNRPWPLTASAHGDSTSTDGLHGVFDAFKSSASSVQDIADGTAKTLLLGEIITDTVSGNTGDTRGIGNIQGSTRVCARR